MKNATPEVLAVELMSPNLDSNLVYIINNKNRAYFGQNPVHVHCTSLVFRKKTGPSLLKRTCFPLGPFQFLVMIVEGKNTYNQGGIFFFFLKRKKEVQNFFYVSSNFVVIFCFFAKERCSGKEKKKKRNRVKG